MRESSVTENKRARVYSGVFIILCAGWLELHGTTHAPTAILISAAFTDGYTV
jgi:hypothetical protein